MSVQSDPPKNLTPDQHYAMAQELVNTIFEIKDTSSVTLVMQVTASASLHAAMADAGWTEELLNVVRTNLGEEAAFKAGG